MVLLNLWRPVPLTTPISESGAGHPQVFRAIPKYLQVHTCVTPYLCDDGRGYAVELHAAHLLQEVIVQPQ